MATLTVKNVGPIREAELEVKKHTIFIGPQGQGKSTLAKLIAIGGDEELTYGAEINHDILQKYSINNFCGEDSKFMYQHENYSVFFEGERIGISYEEEHDKPLLGKNSIVDFTKKFTFEELKKMIIEEGIDKFEQLYSRFLLTEKILQTTSSYIPAERTLLSIINDSIWSLISANINFPKSIISFAKIFFNARGKLKELDIPFLNIIYQNDDLTDKIRFNRDQFIELSRSASGYQSIVPLLVVIEYQRSQANYRFIVEEPELNLYPIAQKNLIYSIVGGLKEAFELQYKNAEWVITTHSPYVLSSYNTLLLAYKVAQKSEDLRAEVEKIIPARCWINPDDFAAYYVDNGTVRSIINPATGLISDNELDDVSEILGAEQDKLLNLNRSVLRD